MNIISIGAAAVARGITTCLTRCDEPFSVNNLVTFVFLLLGPEHADTIAQDFPSKRAVKEYVISKASLPHWAYAPELCNPLEGFSPYKADTLISRLTKPESIHIVFTGGPGKQSQIWAPFATRLRPVSVRVED